MHFFAYPVVTDEVPSDMVAILITPGLIWFLGRMSHIMLTEDEKCEILDPIVLLSEMNE